MQFFGPKSIFFLTRPIFFVTTMTGHQKDNIFLLNPLHGCPQKMVSGQKQHFWTPKGPLWAIGAQKRPAERPNRHLPENQRYPELPQDMGDMWSVRSGASDPKKWGFHRCSVKKCRISGQKCSFLARNPFFFGNHPNFLLPSWLDTKKTTFLCWRPGGSNSSKQFTTNQVFLTCYFLYFGKGR